MNKLLLVAYDFPPRGGSGVFRVLKFARYLPSYGWQPVVLTVADRGPFADERLLAELPPDLEIIRVGRPGASAVVPSSATPASAGAASSWRARLKPWPIPDPQLRWLPGAVSAATRRLAQGDIAALMTSGPPFSTNLIGLAIKRRHPALPWLMDMRDMWSEGLGQRHLVRYRLHRALELRCLARAEMTTVVSDAIRALTIRRLGVDAARIATITNGFDRADLPALPPHQPDPARPLTIRFVGSISDLRAGATAGLWAALGAADLDASQLRIELIGAFGPVVHALAAPLVARGLVSFEPFLPHAAAVARMASADVLLLVLTDDWEGRSMHTSKFSSTWRSAGQSCCWVRRARLARLWLRSSSASSRRRATPPPLAGRCRRCWPGMRRARCRSRRLPRLRCAASSAPN